jgi:hypothetical protein
LSGKKRASFQQSLSAFRSTSLIVTEDMPRHLPKALEKVYVTASRIRNSIRRSKDEEGPGSSAETPAGNTSARTADYSGSIESLHTVAPTFTASGPNLSDAIPRSNSKTSLHSQDPPNLASDPFPSTNDPSARSSAPSGASQIKANQVHVSVHFMLE